MYTVIEQLSIRQDVFRWLDMRLESGKSELTRTELESYHYGDVSIPLLDTARGIRNPRQLDSTLSIMTSYKDPYADGRDLESFVRYSYQTREGGDNLKLRRAFDNADPMIYFQGIRPGVFVAFYPVYVVADDVDDRKFIIALDESLRLFGDPLHMTIDERRYADRLVKQRLHQPVFRARVMYAYASACAVCDLKHADLLDAAHIVPDSDHAGFARVPNGLALCKIHHAAYDRNLLGITPDFEIRIDADLLNEIDGPMLRHGLQDMHRRPLRLPRRKTDRPSRDALAARYAQFAL